uniref:Ovule protein n=1 Tax=Ascaris lumbricoides TaxID=6252 RepID=A0A0M3HZL3_ASCLU
MLQSSSFSFYTSYAGCFIFLTSIIASCVFSFSFVLYSPLYGRCIRIAVHLFIL